MNKESGGACDFLTQRKEVRSDTQRVSAILSVSPFSALNLLG